MSDLFIVRWPKNMTATYVNGATIRFSKNQSVSYANEVLSPGQIICTWRSISDYISSGNTPSLPLLQTNKRYELGIKVKADNDLAVQIQINFFDDNHEKLQSYSSTEQKLRFKVPSGTVAYEVNLINLRHHWLLFDYISISEVTEGEVIVEKQFRKHYEWIHAYKANRSEVKEVRLIVNRGPREIVPLSVSEKSNYDQIFVYTDGQEIDQMVQSLRAALQGNFEYRLTVEAGLGFYTLAREAISKIEMGLKTNDTNRRQNKNDELDY